MSSNHRHEHLHGPETTLPHALPGDRAMWPRDRVVDVKHIKVQLKVDVASKAVSGIVTHTVAPLNDGLRWVEFDAVEMEIESVSVARAAAPYEYDGAKLRVDLGVTETRTGRDGSRDLPGDAAAWPLLHRARTTAIPNKPLQVWSQGQDEDSRYWIPCYRLPEPEADHRDHRHGAGQLVSRSRTARLLQDKANRDGTRTLPLVPGSTRTRRT